MENHFIVERTPMYIQLYAVLDDPSEAERGDCTQFVMDASKDTVEDAIVFLNQNITSELWGVSGVTLVGIVPLVAWENRSVRARKVLSTFLLERVFVPTHQDCLVVTPDNVSDPIVTMEESIEDTSRGIQVLNDFDEPVEVDGITHEESDPLSPEMMVQEESEKDYNRIRDAIGLKALIDATSPEIDDKNIMIYNEESQDDTTVTTERGDGHSTDGFPAALREKREEVEVADKEGPAPQETADRGVVDECARARTDGAVALPGMEKVVPDEKGNDDSSSPHVRELIAKFSGFPPHTKEKEEVQEEDNSFPAVLCDTKEETVLASAEVSIPPEIAKESVPLESDERKTEKDDDEKVVAEMDGVLSTVTQSEQGKRDVPTVRHGTPSGPSYRAEEAASITQQTTAKNTAISNGIDSCNYVEHHYDKAIKDDESTAYIENGLGPENCGIAAVSGAIAKSLSDNEDMKKTDIKLRTTSVDSPTLVDIANDTDVMNEGTSNDINGPTDTKEAPVGTDKAVAYVPAPEEITTKESVAVAGPTSVDMASTEAPLENFFNTEEHGVIVADASNEDFAPDLASSKDDSGKCDYIGQSSKAAQFPLPDDAMSAASSFDNVVVVDLHASEQGLDLPSTQHAEKDLGCGDLRASEQGLDVPSAQHEEKDLDYGESAEINEDSWKTQPDLEDSLRVLFAGVTEPKREATDPDIPMNVSSMLGDIAPSELDVHEPESPPRPPARRLGSDGAPLSPRAGHSTRSPSSLYKIGTAYFILRESDGIEYPVKILSLGKSGTTCIVAYEHHRSKKKVRTSSLLPDTPERRQKFEEQMNLGTIDNDLPTRIAKESMQHRHEEHGHFGRHISRRNLPKCSTEGTIIKESTRRVYFAIDRESVRDVAKKFDVTSERIIYDNKSAYPTLKKSSLLRSLTSLVLPP